MALGCDHCTGGALIGAELAEAGFTAVFRYAARGRGNVNITLAEAQNLRAAGLDIAIVNEHDAEYLLGGYAAGRSAAQGALDVTRAAGLPDGPVFMACDFDVTRSHAVGHGDPTMRIIALALDGARDALGPENVGFYGGFWAIDWVERYRPVAYYWQASAQWGAGTAVHPKACAVQRVAERTVAGVQIDVDELLAADFGQRWAARPPGQEAVVADALGTNAAGALHHFVLDDRGEIWYTWQPPGTTSWSGGHAGKRVAGLQLFAHCTAPEKWTSVSCAQNQGGVFHVVASTDDGAAWYTWQKPGEHGWSGGRIGVAPAGLKPLHPAPDGGQSD